MVCLEVRLKSALLFQKFQTPDCDECVTKASLCGSWVVGQVPGPRASLMQHVGQESEDFAPLPLTLPCAVQADCDWDGVMNRTDFLGVGQEILKNSCDQMDDVKAAFRVFDSNDNGSISKEELREAMVNLGQRCTEE